MRPTRLGIKRFIISSFVALVLNILGASLFAQPSVIYTFSGSPGDYTLNFTLENNTPASQGFDLYFFGVYANGSVSGSPAGYNPSSFSLLHTWDIGTVNNWPYNDTWIDPTYSLLFPGMSRSGFTVLDTVTTLPTSIQYFVWGENNGKVYGGPGSQNIGNPSNPFFVGDAALVPEPSVFILVLAALALLVLVRVAAARK